MFLVLHGDCKTREHTSEVWSCSFRNPDDFLRDSVSSGRQLCGWVAAGAALGSGRSRGCGSQRSSSGRRRSEHFDQQARTRGSSADWMVLSGVRCSAAPATLARIAVRRSRSDARTGTAGTEWCGVRADFDFAGALWSAAAAAGLTDAHGLLAFALSLMVFGYQHFLYAKFIATLVPAWIPFHLFWVYFTGVGLMVTGLAVLVGRFGGRLSTTWLGIMFLL